MTANMLTAYYSRGGNVGELIQRLERLSIRELKKEYPDVDYFDDTDLIECLQDSYQETHRPFIIIIDEWDCIFRGFPAMQEKYFLSESAMIERPKSTAVK